MFNKDYAVKLCEEKNLIYWRIEDPKTGQIAIDQPEKIESAQSAQELNYALSNLTGIYRVTLRKEPFPLQVGRRPKGEDYTFLVNLKPVPVQQTATGINGISIDTYLSLAREKQSLEIELLKKDFEERDSSSSLVEAFAKKALETPAIMEGIGNLLNAFTGGKKKQNIDPEITGAKIKIDPAIINRLAEHDPDLPNTLEMLAKFMDQNPGQFAVVKEQLKTLIK